MAVVNPERVLSGLRELDTQTGGPEGARRVAWTEPWVQARDSLRMSAGRLGLETSADRAGNLWTFLEGESDELVVLGSHLDSVPAGGWLDGALGVLAGLEVLRTFVEDGGRPAKSVALVDWADEEGARFGRSLFGSSAFMGTLPSGALDDLTDANGLHADAVLASHGVRLDELGDPDPLLRRVSAYLELHIEQGPVLERAGLAAGAVTGTVGIERQRFVFNGQAAHAGPTPMSERRDAFLAAAALSLATEQLAIEAGGRATCGRVDLAPGVPTAVAGTAALYVDLRHELAEDLSRLRLDVQHEATRIAGARGCTVACEPIWEIAPRPFDAALVAAAAEACSTVGGGDLTLPSGALHDAAELAAVVPTAMIFCASVGGLSHCPEEDSRPDDLACAIKAFELLVRTALGA